MSHNKPAGSPRHLRSSQAPSVTPPPKSNLQKLTAKQQRELKNSTSRVPTPEKDKAVKQHSVCNICRDDSELRESLKKFDLSEFNSKTAKLQELDVELDERIKQITNIDLRIQHLLLSEPAFKEEKTRMLNIQQSLNEHLAAAEVLRKSMEASMASIKDTCSSILSEVAALKDEHHRVQPNTPAHQSPPNTLAHQSPPIIEDPPPSSTLKPPITLEENYISEEDSRIILENVLNEAETYQKSTSKFTHYGDHKFSKFNLEAKQYPDWLTPYVEKAKTYNHTTKPINSCTINLYEDGNAHLRPHADDEASLSP